MAILSTSNLLSEQRYDVSDARRIESAVRNDFDETVTSIFTNTSQGYIVRGFGLVTSGAIGAPANSLQLQVDPGAVLHIDASVSGTIFQTPTGTPNQVLNASINTAVTGSFAANSTNYVGIDYNRFADPSTNVTKYIWNASAQDEIETIAPAAQTLTFKIYITTSVWALNVLPVAIVKTDSNGNVTEITNAHWDLFSLETGGLNPNPNYVYPWSEGRTRPPVSITAANSSQNPFVGGDKQLTCFKDWANAVMTTFLEIKGTVDWFSGPGGAGPLPSLVSLFQDLGNTAITGNGNISNGILPNADPILVTTGNITQSNNQLTSLASVAGLVDGDYIFATGIPVGTTIVGISGSTITMSNTATLTGTGIGVTFYSPSVITSPGQINWDQPIEIRVIGSSLTYTLVANPSSSSVTLSDDEVAYLELVRDVLVTPNLIFVSGSPTLVSVGAVSWTSSLLAGDYVKVASNDVSDYYKILSVDSPSQVTLTTNVTLADNSGSGGAQAKYAYGSYSTTRNLFITTRETAPATNGNFFWLFLREDNGGNPTVYIRFLSQELDNGESVSVSGTTSKELLEYIGAATAATSKPLYVNALNPNSVPQITHLTVGAGSTITASQYFIIYSSANARQYTVWFKVNGSGSMPLVPFASASIEVDILSSDSATTVATKLASAFNTAFFHDFSAVSGVGTVDVTNTSSGTSSAATPGTMGVPFTISITQSGTGNGNFIVHDGDNLTLAIKELDQAVGSLEQSLDLPNYDEVVQIVTSGASPPNTLNGPISPGTNITLPNNSREGNITALYTVGKGTLQVYLNGQFLDVDAGENYTEVGVAGTPSSQIQIQFGLVVGDELEFRIGAGGGGGGGGLQGPPGNPGPQGPPGADAAGGPVAVSIKTSSYMVLTTDCFLAADCTSGNITFTLPPATGNTGRIFYFKKIDASVNTLTIVGNGSDTIDGASSFVQSVQYQAASMIDNGASWWVF